jgi:hypothetical protein|tara:strand:- start:287 stop:727 length:441 start_codon:yes stop_codon:yes gene_type:complete
MATLTITLTEAVTLGDGSTDRGTTNTQTVTVDEVDHRIMDIPTSWVDIIKFDTANAAGTFADGTVKYLRITNLGSTNFVNLKIRTAAKEYFVKVELEDHFILGNTVMDAESGTGFGGAIGLANIDVISAKADTAAVQIEYFIASAS